MYKLSLRETVTPWAQHRVPCDCQGGRTCTQAKAVELSIQFREVGVFYAVQSIAEPKTPSEPATTGPLPLLDSPGFTWNQKKKKKNSPWTGALAQALEGA